MYVLFPKINKTNMAVTHFLHPNSTAIHYVLFMILSTGRSYAMLLQIDNSCVYQTGPTAVIEYKK